MTYYKLKNCLTQQFARFPSLESEFIVPDIPVLLEGKLELFSVHISKEISLKFDTALTLGAVLREESKMHTNAN